MDAGLAQAKTAADGDEVARLLKTLKLSEEEKDGVVLAAEEARNLPRVKWMAAARLLTSKKFSEASLISTMKAAWNTAQEISFRSTEIRDCANLVTLPNLPPSLKKLIINKCGELCFVSGQLGQLEKLHISKCNKLQSVNALGDASSIKTPEGSELFIGLHDLRIYSCDWDSLPENMEHLVSLQTLEIEFCEKMEHLTTLPRALKTIKIGNCPMLRSICIMDCPRLEFKLEMEKRLEACSSLEYCQDTAPAGTPEQSPYPMIHCPCLVTIEIRGCDNLVTLQNLPPSLKSLIICMCGELCSVSGQLGQLEKLHICVCNKLQSVQSLGDASSLETLSLYRCQCLASLGSNGGPGSYSALRQLRIEYCPAMDMKQFNKDVLDGLVKKDISHALSSNSDESASDFSDSD